MKPDPPRGALVPASVRVPSTVTANCVWTGSPWRKKQRQSKNDQHLPHGGLGDRLTQSDAREFIGLDGAKVYGCERTIAPDRAGLLQCVKLTRAHGPESVEASRDVAAGCSVTRTGIRSRAPSAPVRTNTKS